MCTLCTSEHVFLACCDTFFTLLLIPQFTLTVRHLTSIEINWKTQNAWMEARVYWITSGSLKTEKCSILIHTILRDCLCVNSERGVESMFIVQRGKSKFRKHCFRRTFLTYIMSHLWLFDLWILNQLVLQL